MASISEELESFYSFADVRLRSGDVMEASLDDLYAEWRASNPSHESLEIDVRAVRASLRDMEAGEAGRPIIEFMAEFRQKNGLNR